MMRQSGSRNQRSKGAFKLKLVLQICLLLAICTWLLYQVKHSHDKKNSFEYSISKTATVDSKQPDLFPFSRKSLPIVKQDDSSRDTHTKDEENEQEQEEEKGELDQGLKQEEVKDEEVERDGDDTAEELDQERGDEEENVQEEFFSEEEKDDQVDEEGLFDSKEVEDSAQEAREENYKRDDASSAVAHDSFMEIEDSKVNDLETTVNGSVDDSVNINNETLGYVDPMSNVSKASFGENITLPNTDLSINGSHSKNGLKHTNTKTSLPEENNVSDNDSLPIQNGSKFNHSASNTRISQLGSSGLIPVQGQNYKSDASEGNESEDRQIARMEF